MYLGRLNLLSAIDPAGGGGYLPQYDVWLSASSCVSAGTLLRKVTYVLERSSMQFCTQDMTGFDARSILCHAILRSIKNQPRQVAYLGSLSYVAWYLPDLGQHMCTKSAIYTCDDNVRATGKTTIGGRFGRLL